MNSGSTFVRALIASALAGSACMRATAAAQPNILVIFSDDHGWADFGAQGADQDIRTPYIDQLARDGVRFSRGYVTAPQCVPSRAGLITGRYQQRFGVEDNAHGPLPQAEVTIAERLKPAGYLAGHVGKWHLDIAPTGGRREFRVQADHMPHAQGFDEYWRGEMRQYFASHDLAGVPFVDAPHVVTDTRFRIVVQTEAALGFLDRRTAKPEQPWFLYLAYYAPHVPLESPEPWFARTPTNLPLERRQALAMLAAMDDGVGRIREKLRTIGAETNTLVFFIGDNGAPLGGAWNGSLNRPMVGQKGMLSEGGIRVPFVAAWPGRIAAGQVYDKPVISLDVAATALALAGLPHDKRLDGVNLVPFVTGENKTAPHETLFWRWSSQASVLEFPHKLILLGDRERLLFDVTRPDGENIARNLAARHPEIASRLEAKLRTWCATLQPAGLSANFDQHHESLFAEHDVIAGKAASAKGADDAMHGWLCRNGTLTLQEGALVAAPDPKAAANAKPFLTKTGLDLPGPVSVTLRVRSATGGEGRLAWRTEAQPDFVSAAEAKFTIKPSRDWQDITVELPVEGRLIHLRIKPPANGPLPAFGRIELRGANGAADRSDFSKGNP